MAENRATSRVHTPADGQMFSIGDADVEFSVQSCAKPIIYSLALEEHGAEQVHRYIGREPSGRGFNELSARDATLAPWGAGAHVGPAGPQNGTR